MTETELKRYDDLAMRVDASAPVGSLEETLAIAARKLIKEIRRLNVCKTKWAVVDVDGSVLHVCDDLATAERRCGTSYRVLPYKEPKS